MFYPLNCAQTLQEERQMMGCGSGPGMIVNEDALTILQPKISNTTVREWMVLKLPILRD